MSTLKAEEEIEIDEAKVISAFRHKSKFEFRI